MTLREKIDCMEAFERGEEIECATAGYDTCWHYVKTPSWNWKETDYRIKPRSKQTVVIEKWLLNMKGTKQYVIEEGSKEEIETWGKNETDAWQKVKFLDTYEVEL